jgi:hypothetical protein
MASEPSKPTTAQPPRLEERERASGLSITGGNTGLTFGAGDLSSGAVKVGR